MLRFGKQYPQRTRVIEGCNGVGRHTAMCLVADGRRQSNSSRRCACWSNGATS
jgi:hypothetical protein